MRAGHLRTTYENVTDSFSFQRAPYLHRRLVAHFPIDPALSDPRASEALRPGSAEVTLVAPAPTRKRDEPLRFGRPAGLSARLAARSR